MGASSSSEGAQQWGRRGGGCGVPGGKDTPIAGNRVCEEGGSEQGLVFTERCKTTWRNLAVGIKRQPWPEPATVGPTGQLPTPRTPSCPRRLPQTPAHAPHSRAPVPELGSASRLPGLPAKGTSAFLWQPSSQQPRSGMGPATPGSLQPGGGKGGRFREDSLAQELQRAPSPPAPHAKVLHRVNTQLPRNPSPLTLVQLWKHKPRPQHARPKEPSPNPQGSPPTHPLPSQRHPSLSPGCCGAGTPQAAARCTLLFKGAVWALAGSGLIQGCPPSSGTLGPLLGTGTLSPSPSSQSRRAAPPARAVVTLPCEGGHAGASSGFSSKARTSSC